MKPRRGPRRSAVYSQCGSKKRYRDESHANRVKKFRAEEAGYLRAYDCPFCNGWHLTKQTLNKSA